MDQAKLARLQASVRIGPFALPRAALVCARVLAVRPEKSTADRDDRVSDDSLRVGE